MTLAEANVSIQPSRIAQQPIFSYNSSKFSIIADAWYEYCFIWGEHKMERISQMESQGLFNQTFSVLEKSMNLRSQKHNLMVSNIANMDTPNYKAFDLLVEEEMGKTSAETKTMTLSRTQPGHIPLSGVAGMNVPEIKPVEKPLYDFREDGNTVDIEKTMSALSENGLLYNASAQMIAKKFQSLSNAINGTMR
jgi:flagellar basal-body rod protein FlgB